MIIRVVREYTRERASIAYCDHRGVILCSVRDVDGTSPPSCQPFVPDPRDPPTAVRGRPFPRSERSNSFPNELRSERGDNSPCP